MFSILVHIRWNSICNITPADTISCTTDRSNRIAQQEFIQFLLLFYLSDPSIESYDQDKSDILFHVS